MKSPEFFNSLFVFVFPEAVLRQAKAADNTFDSLASMFIAGVMFSAGAVYAFKAVKMPAIIGISPGFAAMTIVFIFLVMVIAAAVWAYVFDRLYTAAVKVNGRPLQAHPREHLVCRRLLMPYWFLALFFYIMPGTYPFSWVWSAAGAVLLLRLFDLEIRLLRVVYDLRYVQAAAVIALQFLLLALGTAAGKFLQNILIYKQG